MPALIGQPLAFLTAKIIGRVSDDLEFKLFYYTLSKEVERIDGFNRPVLPKIDAGETTLYCNL